MLPREKSSLRSSLMRFYHQYQSHIFMNVPSWGKEKSKLCLLKCRSENIFPYIPKNVQQHHTLDQSWTLRLQHQQYFAAEMSKYSKCFYWFFFSDNLACWDRISIKLLQSSSFLHTCVQVCPRRRIRPEVSSIAIYLCEMYRCCAFVCKVYVNNAIILNKDDHLLSMWLVWLVTFCPGDLCD